MTAPDAQNDTSTAPGEKTPEQSHGEIQQLLRAEIDGLREILETRFREVAALTGRLEEIAGEARREADQEIALLKRRHEVELALVHVRTASWQNGPADGVPAFARQIEILGESPLFDPSWYLQTYPDVVESGMSPKEHYVRAGAFEGRNPGPEFDTMAYYVANPDIAHAGWPALVHYAAFGKADGRPVA
ncbi:hypothetical protein [Salipiger abyssi]|uniref:Glycosyltransferase n=1 Tax=Salipiger abyssi TaxID=1250539 RepID=A0A1P8V0R5_9RHOB|nr:hypothetical protein [Salipiger abyssi]APZ55206.1 Glycosyltransferase [Salipiger abyssi]